MSEKPKLITFLDGAQRTIIGELEGKLGEFQLKVKDPVVVNIVPQYDPVNGQPTGAMALQLLPVFFKEFITDRKQPVIYAYNVDNITSIDFDCEFDDRLFTQYESTINPPAVAASAAAPTAPPSEAGKSKAPVLQLFKDEK